MSTQFIPIKAIATLIYFLVCFEVAYSQSGQWTWMKGDTSFYDWYYKDQLEVEDSSYHPPALYMASNWTDDEGRLWLFGGLNYYQFDFSPAYFDFIWRYNPSTNNWACMKESQYVNGLGEFGTIGVPDSINYPSGRIAAALWKDTSGIIWMFGGVNGWGAWNDLWKFDMETNSWTWVKGPDTWDIAGSYGDLGIPSPDNNPPPRGESASWIDDNNDLWLFGGYWLNTSVGWEYYSDLWRYNIATNMWTWMGGNKEVDQNGTNGIKGIPSATNIPRSRACNCSWTDTAGNFYLFGGTTVFPFQYQFDDVWRYNPNTKEWTWLNGLDTINSYGSINQYCEYSSQNFPISRTKSSCTKINEDEMLMFGGRVVAPSFGSITRDVWKYKISNNEWKIIWGDSLHVPGNFGIQGVYSSTNDPPSRGGAACWKSNEALWLYGGNYLINSNSLADLWRYVLDSTCTIISTSEVINAENFEIEIYPNPATDHFMIKFRDSKLFSARLSIKSAASITLLNKKIETGNVTVNIASLSPGFYYIEIVSNEYKRVLKLIKQ